MRCFEHNGDKCISVNGKDYFLLRGYQTDRDKFFFIQVAGNTPLRKEDMPTKDWEIIQTKTNGKKVWTAFKKACFKYDGENDYHELAFIGATTQGSYFLALRWIARKFNQNIPDEALYKLGCKLASSENNQRGLNRCQDIGSFGEDAVALQVGITAFEEEAIEILKGCEK